MRIRIPLTEAVATRDGTTTKDSKIVNGFLDVRNKKPAVTKRFGLTTYASLPVGEGQGMFYLWSGYWMSIQAMHQRDTSSFLNSSRNKHNFIVYLNNRISRSTSNSQEFQSRIHFQWDYCNQDHGC